MESRQVLTHIVTSASTSGHAYSSDSHGLWFFVVFIWNSKWRRMDWNQDVNCHDSIRLRTSVRADAWSFLYFRKLDNNVCCRKTLFLSSKLNFQTKNCQLNQKIAKTPKYLAFWRKKILSNNSGKITIKYGISNEILLVSGSFLKITR
jgi:hypothetical protein